MTDPSVFIVDEDLPVHAAAQRSSLGTRDCHKANEYLLCRLAAFCAQIAAKLPFTRADEPLLLLYHTNQLIARHGEEALAALKICLEGRRLGQQPSQGTDAIKTESPAGCDQDVSGLQVIDLPLQNDHAQFAFSFATKCLRH